jgi:small conductance mechanosensitive channel
MPFSLSILAQTAPAAEGAADKATATQVAILPAGQSLYETGIAFLTTNGIAFGINLAAAIAILLIGRWAANVILRLVERVMNRARIDQTLIKFACSLIYALIVVFVVIAALNRLGVDTTSLAAVLAAAGLAIGLALQGSLSNFAAGVMLIFFKPFKAGDTVEVGGSTGTVEEIQLFNTVMCTGDNVQITVPNSKITTDKITNFSAKATRRIDLVIGCGYGDDLKAVKDYLEELLNSDERILKDPAPVVAVNELADSCVKFVVRPWVKNEDYWSTRWDLTEKIKLDFDQRGFSIPYPTRDLHVHNVA